MSESRIFRLSTQKLQTNDLDLQKHPISAISFTHFVELIKIDNPVKRSYYELLIVKTQLNVKELKKRNSISQL